MKVGDLVTRDGSDVHEVLSLAPDAQSGEFKCVKAPASGWCKVGDVEYNQVRRYQPVQRAAPSETQFVTRPTGGIFGDG